jgi:hypothetical protein
MLAGRVRHKMALAVTTFALRHLGPKRLYDGEVEEAARKDWKASMRRLGLRRHTPWHDRFRRSWIRLCRDR